MSSIEALRFELCEIGVRVKLIEPGIVDTNFFNATECNNDGSMEEYQGADAEVRRGRGRECEGWNDPSHRLEITHVRVSDHPV
jgi:NAD(P)-dependent dehydrogenase (short-subunit alcohol dehydrogenase family)